MHILPSNNKIQSTSFIIILIKPALLLLHILTILLKLGLEVAEFQRQGDQPDKQLEIDELLIEVRF